MFTCQWEYFYRQGKTDEVGERENYWRKSKQREIGSEAQIEEAALYNSMEASPSERREGRYRQVSR